MYEFGIGVDVDEDEAFYYYKKGADVGDAFSIDSLAECYRKGIGTVSDMGKYEELKKLYKEKFDEMLQKKS